MSAGGEGNPERDNSLSVTTEYRPIKSSNKIASFPCLAHVINLIAKRLLLSRAANIESEDDDLHKMPVDEVTNAAEILLFVDFYV